MAERMNNWELFVGFCSEKKVDCCDLKVWAIPSIRSYFSTGSYFD